MITSCLKSALRNIRRARLYAFINISGLALGLAATIMAGLWIYNQLTYDTYNVKANRIYRVCTSYRFGGNEYHLALTAAPLAAKLRGLPQVESTVRMSMPYKDVVVRAGNHEFNVDDFFYADSDFFDVFSVHLLEGAREGVLSNPYFIVINKSMAKRLFGNSNPVGKTLSVGTFNKNHDYLVTGVFADAPQNSQFHPDFISSFSTLRASGELNKYGWFGLSYYTYILLRPGASIGSVVSQLPAVVSRNMGARTVRTWYLSVQKLTNIHLQSHLLFEIEPNGSTQTVLMVFVIGLCILLISNINFVSLSTARFADRAREVGVRKVFGANRKQLVIQFMSESIVMALMSSAIAVSIVELALPFFNNIAGATLSLPAYDLVVVLAGIVIVGGIAGSYPAFFLSSFRPTSIFRREPVVRPGGVGIRKGIVVFQFVLATGVVIATLIVSRQLYYVEHRNPGFDKDDVLVMPLRHRQLHQEFPVLKTAFESCPGVLAVSGATGRLGNTDFVGEMTSRGRNLFETRWLGVDRGFLKTMGLRLMQGRWFSAERPSDSTSSIVVNEAAAKKLLAMGYFGQPLSPNGSGGLSDVRVIGVLKDFNYRNLYHPVQPLYIYLSKTRDTEFMMVRISRHNVGNTLATLRNIWKKIVPQYPLDFRFLNKSIDGEYTSTHRLSGLFDGGSFLALFIAAIGLFGLSSYAVEKRVKEIGIRKVLGASEVDIISLLMRDFLLLVAIGAIIGCSVAYYFMNRWLQDFAYKVDLSPGIFLLAAAIPFVTAAATVSFRAMRAATANPVESLRYE